MMEESYEIVKRYEVKALDQKHALAKLFDLEVAGHQFLVETGVYVRKGSFPTVQSATTPRGHEQVVYSA